MTEHSFRWLPNFFTICRLLLAPVILLAAWQEAWAWALWLMLVALLTDFLDGWAALRLHAQTAMGEKLDPIADAILAAVGLLAAMVAGDLSLWLLCLAIPFALGAGYVKLGLSSQSRAHRVQPMLTAPLLFVIWTLETWYYATHMAGWQWWYVLLTAVLLVAMAIPKKHRLRVWFAWALKGRS